MRTFRLMLLWLCAKTGKMSPGFEKTRAGAMMNKSLPALKEKSAF